MTRHNDNMNYHDPTEKISKRLILVPKVFIQILFCSMSHFIQESMDVKKSSAYVFIHTLPHGI